MAWNGSGTFNRLYSWVSDALAGTKISATRMDAEFDGFKAGLENCLCRDGQNSASADINFGSHKAKSLAAPTTWGDALRIDEYWNRDGWLLVPVQSDATTGTLTWLTGTTFKIAGNYTSLFTVGRRLKLIGSAGTTYHTVLSSSYDGSAYTTVTHANDSTATTSLTSAYVSMDDPSLIFRGWHTCAQFQLTANYAGAAYADLSCTILNDILTEVAASVFTAKITGWYLVSGAVSFTPSNATNQCKVKIVTTGTGQITEFQINNLPNLTQNTLGFGASMLYLTAGQTIKFQGVVTAGQINALQTQFQITRVAG